MKNRSTGASKLVNASWLLETGDHVTIAGPNGKHLVAAQDGRLLASTTDAHATRFQVEVSGSRFRLKTDGRYVAVSPDKLLGATATSPEAALLLDLMIGVGKTSVVIVGDDARWALQDDQSIVLDTKAIGLVTEYSLHVVTPALPAADAVVLLGIPINPCTEATAILLYQSTIGLVLATGLGPFFATGKAEPGLVALVSTNKYAAAALDVIKETAKENPGKILGASLAFLGVLRTQHLLKPFIRAGLNSAGWYAAAAVLAKIIELLVVSEEEAVDLIVGFTLWSAQTVKAGVNMAKACE